MVSQQMRETVANFLNIWVIFAIPELAEYKWSE